MKKFFSKISPKVINLAKNFGFDIIYNPGLSSSYAKTFNHIVHGGKIIIVNNYRGYFRSQNKRFILDSFNDRPGVANLYIPLVGLPFEKNIFLVVPYVDPVWIKYLFEAGLYPKGFNYRQRLIPVKLKKLNSSPIKALMGQKKALSKIEKNSLLVTTFNDEYCLRLAKLKKIILSQGNINSYEGNSKINQRLSGLPMLPSLVVKNDIESKKAINFFLNLGVNRIWIKCGNNMGAGQFMEGVDLKSDDQSIARVIEQIRAINLQQRRLSKKSCVDSTEYESAEIMLEADFRLFGELVLCAGVNSITKSKKHFEIYSYAEQLKDPLDESKYIGSISLSPQIVRGKEIFFRIMQSLAIYTSIRCRKRNYFGIVGTDVYILKTNLKLLNYYKAILRSCGQVVDNIVSVRSGEDIYLGIIAEINERETMSSVVDRLRSKLGYSCFLSIYLKNLPQDFDFYEFEKLLKLNNLSTKQVVPITKMPEKMIKGLPVYNGASNTIFTGIFGNSKEEVLQQYSLLVGAIHKLGLDLPRVS